MTSPTCQCEFPDECSGAGVVHCDPPCGGDQCVCACGGERDCEGCAVCDPVGNGDDDLFEDLTQ